MEWEGLERVMQVEKLQSEVFTGNEVILPEAKTLIILLHGLGSNGDDLISLAPPLQEHLQQAIAYLSPNAPEGFMGMEQAYQWFSLGNYNPAERNFDDYMPEWSEAVHKPQKALTQFITEQQARLDIAPERTALIGFSQGGMVSLTASTLQPLGAVVSFSGALLSPQDFTASTKLPPYLLLHGELDEVVPPEASRTAHAHLQSVNATATLHTYADLPHSINAEGIATAANFCKKALQF